MSQILSIPNSRMLTGKDGSQHSWGSIKLLIATLIVSTLGDGFCGVMMAVALPNISETYHISLSTANLVTFGYSIVAATAVMSAATTLKRYGLRKLFFFSRILLIVSSAIGLFSLNFPMMLGSRLIQAVGSGLMYPTINTVIIRGVPDKISGQVVSLNSAIIGIGIAVAPILSGLFLTYVSLTSMYIVPLVIGIISLIMGMRFVFNIENREPLTLDALSILLAFAGLAFMMIGFSELTHRPTTALMMIVVGALILAWFTRRQFHIKTPLIDLQPMRRPAVSIGVLLYIAGSMGQQAVLLLLPLYLERSVGYTPFVAGALLLIVALAYSGAIIISGRSVDRRGMWPIVSIGFLVMTVGMFALVLGAPTHSALLAVILGSFAVVGDAFINVPDKDVVFEMLPDQQVPDTSALYSTGAQIGGSLASALFVGILSANVLRLESHNVTRDIAYSTGFQRSILVAAIFEAVMLVVSVWYSRQMVRHGLSTLDGSQDNTASSNASTSTSSSSK